MNTPSAIFQITKDKKVSDLEKIKKLTALYFANNNLATGPCQETSRIMLAIETIATESIIKQRG